MGETMVQDVLGQPESWTNCVSDQLIGLPDMRAATIGDVFVCRNKITLLVRGSDGAEAVAVFVIEDQELREKIAAVMRPGENVQAALRAGL